MTSLKVKPSILSALLVMIMGLLLIGSIGCKPRKRSKASVKGLSGVECGAYRDEVLAELKRKAETPPMKAQDTDAYMRALVTIATLQASDDPYVAKDAVECGRRVLGENLDVKEILDTFARFNTDPANKLSVIRDIYIPAIESMGRSLDDIPDNQKTSNHMSKIYADLADKMLEIATNAHQNLVKQSGKADQFDRVLGKVYALRLDAFVNLDGPDSDRIIETLKDQHQSFEEKYPALASKEGFVMESEMAYRSVALSITDESVRNEILPELLLKSENIKSPLRSLERLRLEAIRAAASEGKTLNDLQMAKKNATMELPRDLPEAMKAIDEITNTKEPAKIHSLMDKLYKLVNVSAADVPTGAPISVRKYRPR